MPDETRKDWLREKLAKADYCHLGAWGSDDVYDVQGDLEDLLTENERQKKSLDAMDSAIEMLHGQRRALVAVLRLLNEPIAYCAYPGFEKDVAYNRVERMREAVQALGKELQEAIDA